MKSGELNAVDRAGSRENGESTVANGVCEVSRMCTGATKYELIGCDQLNGIMNRTACESTCMVLFQWMSKHEKKGIVCWILVVSHGGAQRKARQAVISKRVATVCPKPSSGAGPSNDCRLKPVREKNENTWNVSKIAEN